jgi:hypothetical protein
MKAPSLLIKDEGLMGLLMLAKEVTFHLHLLTVNLLRVVMILLYLFQLGLDRDLLG